ncbi:N-acetylglucosamine regulated methyl-accepting chemotaxis protein [Photobacterium aphoticum]|uniref:N-acetylglucosamine regulated methyl-accepting chemotaxis protein n=1 Tax=Photobacterium aphoticum TaxID=754436 RepID=A0A090QWD4_9GAMM|nr:N-acetylglucosamine regulated methyl-accepting chemotaxis protein [Photobacterium aphoticum]
MKLSVVQRTVAGFTLMFVLMALLSSVSLFNAQSLQNKVEHITEQTTPMVVASGSLITQLMQTSLLINTFHDDPAQQNRVNQTFLIRNKPFSKRCNRHRIPKLLPVNVNS